MLISIQGVQGAIPEGPEPIRPQTHVIFVAGPWAHGPGPMGPGPMGPGPKGQSAQRAHRPMAQGQSAQRAPWDPQGRPPWDPKGPPLGSQGTP